MENTTWRFAGMFMLISSGWLPDGKHFVLRIPQKVACATPQTMVVVEWASVPIAPHSSALNACHLALSASQYLLRFATRQKARIEPLIVLVPPGAGVSRTTVSFYPPGPLKPTFFTRWHRSIRAMEAGIVDDVAHELFHILTDIQPDRQANTPNEPLAYRVGSCAQLAVNGGIYLNSIVAGEVPDDLEPGAVRTSMAAANAHYRTLLPMFDGGDWIPESSPAAQKILDDCRTGLAAWFDSPYPAR